jgi:hypothetical protein
MANVTQQRFNSDARTYLDRKTGEGTTRQAAGRAHKRHLANAASGACGQTITTTPPLGLLCGGLVEDLGKFHAAGSRRAFWT